MPALRLNGTTDIHSRLFLDLALYARAHGVQVYDYTKQDFQDWGDYGRVVDLTWSFDGRPDHSRYILALERGYRVAVPFEVKPGDPLPATWHGFPVIDGDLHDCTFLQPQGVVIGLRAKGKARKAKAGGFVQLAVAS